MEAMVGDSAVCGRVTSDRATIFDMLVKRDRWVKVPKNQGRGGLLGISWGTGGKNVVQELEPKFAGVESRWCVAASSMLVGRFSRDGKPQCRTPSF